MTDSSSPSSPRPGLPATPDDRLSPPWCPGCFMTETEQAIYMATSKVPVARCHPGSCVTMAVMWPAEPNGHPAWALYPWVDNIAEDVRR